MLLLRHLRGWSYQEVTREVRANLVYREFTGVGGGKVPDDKTMGRLARQRGPEAIELLHRRMVAIAQEKKIVTDKVASAGGAQMRGKRSAPQARRADATAR
jgi:IS5 family transposase